MFDWVCCLCLWLLFCFVCCVFCFVWFALRLFVCYWLCCFGNGGLFSVWLLGCLIVLWLPSSSNRRLAWLVGFWTNDCFDWLFALFGVGLWYFVLLCFVGIWLLVAVLWFCGLAICVFATVGFGVGIRHKFAAFFVVFFWCFVVFGCFWDVFIVALRWWIGCICLLLVCYFGDVWFVCFGLLGCETGLVLWCLFSAVCFCLFGLGAWLRVDCLSLLCLLLGLLFMF